MINIENNDWSGICILENSNKLFRKDIPEEKGNYNILDNILTIKWEKWEEEIFIQIDKNKYLKSNIFYKNYDTFDFYDKITNKITTILNKSNNTFYTYDKRNNISGNFLYLNNDEILLNSKKYIKINKKSYFLLSEYEITFFELIVNNNIILFNKINNFFYEKESLKKLGSFEMIYNKLVLNYLSGFSETFYVKNVINSNNSIIENIENQENNNLKILYPKNIIINNRILFSNINLINNKIYLTSLHYIDNPWIINNLVFKIDNYKIINKTIYENKHFETSLTIILEIENINSNNELINNVSLNIIYTNICSTSHFYTINLENEFLDVSNNNILLGAMTLFKDDYELLSQYISYYEKLGIGFFLFYYNDILTTEIINKIKNILKNANKSTIFYLIEWNYEYWWKTSSIQNNKHHHAQTMALNNSLNIMKNFCKYVLYNDLDEYFILKKYNTFIDLINYNSNIDIFTFKNRFCTMSNELISYNEFKDKYDENKIITGNYWDCGREKNLFKIENINVMGVHCHYAEFTDKPIMSMIVGEFYHFVNFKEKDRLYLMTEYIVI